MEEKVGIVVLQEEKTETGVQAENKDVCVACEHHAPEGHGEWRVCMEGDRGKIIIRVPRSLWGDGADLGASIKDFPVSVGLFQAFDWTTPVLSGIQCLMGKVQLFCKKMMGLRVRAGGKRKKTIKSNINQALLRVKAKNFLQMLG